MKNDDEKGPSVKDNLTEKVNDNFIGDVGSDKITTKQKGYLCPNNCHTFAAIPQCNKELW